MELVRLLSHALRIAGFVRRLVAVVVVSIVGWALVEDMVASGQLPPAPLGLAATGLPATVFGIPAAYAGGILLFDGFLLFGESGSGPSVDDGVGDGHGGGFGDGGGGGGDGGE